MKKNKLSIYLLLFLFAIQTISLADENATKKKRPPTGFIDVVDIIPDIILDIRYATPNNFVGEVLDGYMAPRAFLLTKVAEALKNVQASLKEKGYSLKVFDGYRPMRAEKHMIRWAIDNNKKAVINGGYLPAVNPHKTLGHSCGNAIDLTIIDKNGNELDMGTEFDFFGDASWTYNAKDKVLENRLFLKKEMEKAGFKNYHKEWWHYSFHGIKNKACDFIIE